MIGIYIVEKVVFNENRNFNDTLLPLLALEVKRLFSLTPRFFDSVNKFQWIELVSSFYVIFVVTNETRPSNQNFSLCRLKNDRIWFKSVIRLFYTLKIRLN